MKGKIWFTSGLVISDMGINSTSFSAPPINKIIPISIINSTLDNTLLINSLTHPFIFRFSNSISEHTILIVGLARI